jgi:hypothetical protein
LDKQLLGSPCFTSKRQQYKLSLGCYKEGESFRFKGPEQLELPAKEMHLSTNDLRLRTTTSAASEIYLFFYIFLKTRDDARSHVTHLGPTIRQAAG